MGMALFTTSSTFTPSDYGLVAGDNIVVVCVGGGQGGGGYNYASSSYNHVSGSSGSASSFGSLVSASGGSQGAGYGVELIQAYYSGSTLYRNVARFGGVGEDGYWHTDGFVQFSITGLYTNKNISSSSSSSTKPSGGAGSVYSSTGSYENFYYTYIIGPGGLGYGAGGGGGNGYYSSSASATSTRGYVHLGGRGGRAGTLKNAYIKLTAEQAVTAFTITVGAGGAGASDYSSNNVLCGYGGGGAKGCVAAYW